MGSFLASPAVKVVSVYKYQSLEAWKRAHAVALLVLRETDAAYQPKARSLFDQIRRAAFSVEANIVEGYALGTRPQFLRHLRIARGSAAEAECLVRLAAEADYLSKEVSLGIEDLLGATMRALHGLLRRPPVVTVS